VTDFTTVTSLSLLISYKLSCTFIPLSTVELIRQTFIVPNPWSGGHFKYVIVTQPGNSQLFMEPKDSLPYSQRPIAGLYPEPDESIPHLSTLFTNDVF
jgi:hypothetical protein